MKFYRYQKGRSAISWLCLMLLASCGADVGKKGSKGGPGSVKVRGMGDGEEAEGIGSDDQSGGDSEQASNGPGGGAGPGEGGEGGDGNAPTDVRQVFVNAGLRNYAQINATMSLLTGVPQSHPTVSQVFNTQLSTGLPTDNDIKAFLGSQQVAVFKLAVEYCDAMIKDANISRTFFGNVAYTGAPSAVLSAQGKPAVADLFVTKFWGKGLEALPPHDQSVASVVGLIDQLLANKDAANVAVTPPVLTGTCAGVLSSAPVTMF